MLDLNTLGFLSVQWLDTDRLGENGEVIRAPVDRRATGGRASESRCSSCSRKQARTRGDRYQHQACDEQPPGTSILRFFKVTSF